METPYMLPILYCQYHARNHSIDQMSRNILRQAAEELINNFSISTALAYSAGPSASTVVNKFHSCSFRSQKSYFRRP